MIDLLLLIGLSAGAVVFMTRRMAPRRLILVFSAFSCIAHGACLAVLYFTDARYAYVAGSSRAAEAGLKGPGAVQAVGGAPIASLGAFLALAFAPGEAKIDGAGDFTRAYHPFDHWRFWRALDSYVLEEAAGGLVFFPRRPIWRHAGESDRVISVHGVETDSIDRFLTAVADVPPKGVFYARIMRSTPDSGVVSVPVSPVSYLSADAESHFGLSGLPVLLVEPGREWFFRVLYRAGERALYGPADLQREIRLNSVRRIPAAHGARILMRPRLALLPRIYENAVVSWAAGSAGAYLRQLFGLKELRYVAAYWDALPKQWYLLDDRIGAASLFFKLGSLSASLVLSFISLLLALRFLPRGRKFVERNRSKLAFASTMVFQLADLFVFRFF